MTRECLRIRVADDHELVRKGLRSMLQSREGWAVCGEATNGREAVAMATELNPHIVVMDLTIPEMNGLDAIRQIRRLRPDCAVLILTMHHSEQIVREVLLAGARGYVLKSDVGSIIFDAIDALCQGKPFFTPEISQVLLDSDLVRVTLQAYLRTDARFDIVGTAEDGLEGVAKVNELKPDLVIMDYSMPRMNGLEATRAIKQQPDPPCVVIFSADPSQAARASDAGADGFCDKHMQAGELLAHILSLFSAG